MIPNDSSKVWIASIFIPLVIILYSALSNLFFAVPGKNKIELEFSGK
jgi:hypothetical protein